MWPKGRRPEPETKLKGRASCAPWQREVDHREDEGTTAPWGCTVTRRPASTLRVHTQADPGPHVRARQSACADTYPHRQPHTPQGPHRLQVRILFVRAAVPRDETNDLPKPADVGAHLLQRAAGSKQFPGHTAVTVPTRVAARLPTGHSEALQLGDVLVQIQRLRVQEGPAVLHGLPGDDLLHRHLHLLAVEGVLPVKTHKHGV